MTSYLNAEQYNLVPHGYNNNIIWNMGHLLIVSESYLYRNSTFKAPSHVFDISLFDGGTSPEQDFTTYGISLIRQSLLETVPVFESKSVVLYETKGSDNPPSNSVCHAVSEASLRFILFHEDIHYHTVKKMVQLMLPAN